MLTKVVNAKITQHTFCESNDRWCSPWTLSIFNNFWIFAFHYCNTWICCAQINSDNRSFNPIRLESSLQFPRGAGHILQKKREIEIKFLPQTLDWQHLRKTVTPKHIWKNFLFIRAIWLPSTCEKRRLPAYFFQQIWNSTSLEDIRSKNSTIFNLARAQSSCL